MHLKASERMWLYAVFEKKKNRTEKRSREKLKGRKRGRDRYG
jgi:hypothetical protein